MALGVTEEHLQLAESVRGWAERAGSAELARAAASNGDRGSPGYRDVLAASLAGQGLLGLHVPEDDGGQGYGIAELAVAVEELGRALLPGAFLPTVLASACLLAGGMPGKLVAALADGSRSGAAGLGRGLRGSRRPDGGLVVDGDAGPVLGAGLADLLVLPVDTDDGETWIAADAASLEISDLQGLDLTRPMARVRADHVTVPAGRLLPGLSRATVSSLAATLFGAEACGIADWAVQTAADYAKMRHQFGRPIGQFQAVKHRCARMLTAAEQAAAAVWDAAQACPAGAAARARGSIAEFEFAAGVAASVAIDAAVSCSDQCIQVLGGIGYTWEHEAHLYYRRAMSLRALLGPAGEWKQRVAELAMAGATRPVRLQLADADGDSALRSGLRAELARVAALSGRDRTDALAAGGWVMPHLPRPWGRGAGAYEQLVIDEEMRAAGVRAPGLAIGAWVVPALIRYGSAEQQERFLPATLRAEYLWCQLFSEPGAGSDLAGLSTRAVRADGGWKITGQKIWTSLAREAAWAICLARTDPAAPKHDGITYFLVDMRSAGVEVRPLREITGDSLFNQVFLDEVLVPDDCVVGAVNDGWRVARTTLANERVSLSRSWTFGAGVPELLEVIRAVGSPPLAVAGELVCHGQAIGLLALRAALKQLSGTEPGATGSVRKLLGMQHAQRIAEFCWELSAASGALGSGGASPVTEAGIPDGGYWARQVLQTRALTIGGGTTDIQLNIIGERILGLPRDSEPSPR